MATPLQLVANQRNSTKSTGPRTLTGKAASSRNALKHGLTSNQGLMPFESSEEFSAVRQGLFNALLPQNVLENQLVERAASLIWRLRRFPTFEAALFDWIAYQEKLQHDEAPTPPDEAEHEVQAFGPPVSDLQDNLGLGRMLDTFLSTEISTRLSSYESKTQAQLHSTLETLRQTQTLRVLKSEIKNKELDRARPSKSR